MIGQIKKVSNFYSIKFLIYLFMCLILFINICLAADNTKWLKINKAGMSAFKERDFINSEKLYIEAIYEAKKNNLVAELSATLNNLGLLKIELFQYKESEILFNESLKIRLAYYGLNHRYVAQSYNNLARLYESSDRYNESIDFYIKAINIYEILGNRYSMLLARTLVNLSTTQLKIDMLEVAKMNLIRALTLSKKFGEDNLVSLSAMQNLAAIFTQRGNFNEAEELYLTLIKINRDSGNTRSIDFARVLNNLSVLYKKNCKYELALPYIIESIKIRENIKSIDYKNFAKAYHNQGELYKAQGKYNLAINSFIKGLKIISISLDVFYLQYIEQSYALINLYMKSGKTNEAMELINTVNLQRKKKGEDSITLENLPEEVYENCSSSNI